MLDAPAFPLQVFYDGSCSVCAAEMDIYRRREHAGRLIFVDISRPDFDPAPHGISLQEFMHEMHGIDQQGRVFRGLEAFRAIWQAFPDSVRYRLLAALITLPGVNQLARMAYWSFAGIRKYLPRRHSDCDSGVCRR